MKNQIVKVIYLNGEEKEFKSEIKPLAETTKETPKWKARYEYLRQFKEFEETILKSLNNDTVKSYAEWTFDLVEDHEDDDEDDEKGIDEFSDSELLEELKCRKLHINHSILTEDFLPRFLKIIEKENSILLDNLLTEFEKKLNL